MRRIAALIGLSFATMMTAAHADVSDNLVFCSKLGNSRERIACYDAAARIAGNGGTRPAVARSGSSSLVTAPAASMPTAPYMPVTETPRFQGGYVAFGGSYGIGGPLVFSVVDQVQSFTGVGEPQGPSVIAAAGYNLQIGNLVTGVELSGRLGREAFAASSFGIHNDPLGVVGASVVSTTFNVDASVHAGLRAGPRRW